MIQQKITPIPEVMTDPIPLFLQHRAELEERHAQELRRRKAEAIKTFKGIGRARQYFNSMGGLDDE